MELANLQRRAAGGGLARARGGAQLGVAASAQVGCDGKLGVSVLGTGEDGGHRGHWGDQVEKLGHECPAAGGLWDRRQ